MGWWFDTGGGAHVGDGFHHVVLRQDVGGVVHHFLNGFAFTRAFEGAACDVGHGFGMVELEAFLEAALSYHSESQKGELVLLFRC